jgi:hypothetical protein
MKKVIGYRWWPFSFFIPPFEFLSSFGFSDSLLGSLPSVGSKTGAASMTSFTGDARSGVLHA